jgi:2-polyprenyl-6-methoxyphenol hydroxylase-like FAD-dependent oxidoreductase
MTATVLIVGAGPVGLAVAMLLAGDGHEVTVLDRDAPPVPPTVEEAWERWERPGVAQFRQAHFMQPRFRHVLDAELPAVRDRLEELGGRRFNLLEALPGAVTGPPQPHDHRFTTLTGRRPVIECAFAQVAEDTAGVKIQRGVTVAEALTGPSVRTGVPHVRGVLTTDGAAIPADLVVDAMGRRSRLLEWVASVGGRPPYEEASDTGFAYYTRHFRSRDGSFPEFKGPISATLDTILALTVPADGETWTVAIAAMAGDKPLKSLRNNATWERVARAVPHLVHWLDGEPLCDVTVMAGVLDRRRRMVVEGRPVVSGLLPVGDAWACTNPTAGRGISLGLAQAVALRNLLRQAVADPAALVEAYDVVTETELTPWYREQVDRDNLRAAEITAAIEGRRLSPTDDRGDSSWRALAATAQHDPDVARALLDVVSCLSLPKEVLARAGIRRRVESFRDRDSAPTPAPSRAQLLDLVA